jgi:cell wall-associated NlpC family hydrolase
VNVGLIASRPKARAGLRGRLVLVLAVSVVLIGMLPGPVQAGWLTNTWPGYDAAPGSEAARVLDLVRRQVGKPYKYATAGPDTFDCSGLIWYVFKTAGLGDRIGSKRRGATAYLNWFKTYGRWSPNLADARAGDILIWGGGQHAGIYVSGNWAVSALNTRYDVRIHRADPMGLPFTAVLMVDMSRNGDSNSTPDPNATPTPTPDPNASPTPTPTAPVAPPRPPTTFTAVANSDLTVSLNWSGATGDATPLKYRVYRNGVYYVGTRYETLLDHLWLPGKYTYAIQTVDANGTRSFRSFEVPVTAYVAGTPTNVVDTTPPTVPTDLTAESLGDKQVALSWTASTDPGPTGVGYLIKRGSKIIARVWTTSYIDRPATAGTYGYSVVAFDGYGNNVTSDKVYGEAAW